MSALSSDRSIRLAGNPIYAKGATILFALFERFTPRSGRFPQLEAYGKLRLEVAFVSVCLDPRCVGVGVRNPNLKLEILGYSVSGEEFRASRLGVPQVLAVFVLLILKTAA